MLIEVAEDLLKIGNVNIEEREKCRNKAIYLMKIVKSMNADSSYFDLYFQLTGEKLQNTIGEFDNISRELDQLQKKNIDGDLIAKKKIAGVSEIPKINNDKK